MLNRLLYKSVDNSSLVVFRIFFGLLMVAEGWGAIATGWVKETFVEVDFTFTFMGFEWTRAFLGESMYGVYFVLGALGWFIALGYYYRIATFLFAVLWSLVYFMQKSHYNNHYYLLVLVAWVMAIVPAHRWFSMDARRNPEIKSEVMPLWVKNVFVWQVAIVYFFAAVAKLYPGWWEGKFLNIRLKYSAYWFKQNLGWDAFADFISKVEFAQFLSVTGLFFDALVVPALLWKPTRNLAFFGMLVFHLFNSITLHIGIFPYFALAFAVFFYSSDKIRKTFLPKKPKPKITENKQFSTKPLFSALFLLYFIWQVYLPLRHWHIPGDVLWTEEGHRLAWRMMLRTKTGRTYFYVQEADGSRRIVNTLEYLSNNQAQSVKVKPDMMWQFAQYLEEVYAREGKGDVKIYVDSKISVNGSDYQQLTNKDVDLTEVEWNRWGHQDWILDHEEFTFSKSR